MNRTTRTALLVQIILLVGLITLAGAGAFFWYERGVARDAPFDRLTYSDSVWWALVTMTTIGYGDLYPRTAEGRCIAVVMMFFGIGLLGVSTAAIAAYFVENNQLQLFRLRYLRDHVIVCGLGEKGYLLTRAYRGQGKQVVVVEQDELNDLIPSCREQGAIVLVGDATDDTALDRAGVDRARTLLAVTGNDGTNAEITTHARSMTAGRKRGLLTCCAHIVDPHLWYLLRRWEVMRAEAFRLVFFNVYDIGARVLLEQRSPTLVDLVTGAARNVPSHIVIIGLNRLGESVVLHAGRAWRDQLRLEEDLRAGSGEVAPTDRKLRVTLVDRDADHHRASLQVRHPELAHSCTLLSFPHDAASPEFIRGDYLLTDGDRSDIDAIYVCLDDDDQCLSVALSIQHRIRHLNIPVVVRMTRDAGLSTLLKDAPLTGASEVIAVGLLERICRPEMVLGSTNEILAREIHEQYLREQRFAPSAGKAGNPALVPWEQLPDEIKESNRNQAGHICEKLRTIGCDLVPLTDGHAANFVFSPEEVEKMARMEHERWMEERLANGWSYGERDAAKKTNPSLVPWDSLSEVAREFNRESIRRLPQILVRAGFQIGRLPEVAAEPRKAPSHRIHAMSH